MSYQTHIEMITAVKTDGRIIKVNNMNAHRFADIYVNELDNLYAQISAETRGTDEEGNFSHLLELIGQAHLHAREIASHFDTRYNENY